MRRRWRPYGEVREQNRGKALFGERLGATEAVDGGLGVVEVHAPTRRQYGELGYGAMLGIDETLPNKRTYLHLRHCLVRRGLAEVGGRGRNNPWRLNVRMTAFPEGRSSSHHARYAHGENFPDSQPKSKRVSTSGMVSQTRGMVMCADKFCKVSRTSNHSRWKKGVVLTQP